MLFHMFLADVMVNNLVKMNVWYPISFVDGSGGINSQWKILSRINMLFQWSSALTRSAMQTFESYTQMSP